MAFDNWLGKSKDWRKPYYDRARNVDWECRHGGSCDWCSNNRQFKNRRRAPIEHPVEFAGYSYRKMEKGEVTFYSIYEYLPL